jgi:DegV family protein with EDD domain
MTDRFPAIGPHSNEQAQPRPAMRQRAPARVRIVADSATDILPAHATALGITVVPNRIILDGSELRDGIDITPSQFFARLPRARAVRTEPASAREFYYAYQAVFRQGATDVLSIHVSSRLSKVVENALAAKEYLAHAPIHIIDSYQAGIGIWPAVITAAKLASTGAPIEDVHATTLQILTHTRVYLLVETLEYLRRGGRIGRAQELLGTLMNAHPILTIEDGEVAPVETVRPRWRAVQRLRDLAFTNGPPESLLICGSAIETISELESVLAERYTGTIQKTWLGPTLGANTGPMVALAVVSR